MTNSAYCTQRNGQPRKGISRFSSGKCFAGDRENLDYTTISSTSTDPRHYRRCFPQFDRKTDCFRHCAAILMALRSCVLENEFGGGYANAMKGSICVEFSSMMPKAVCGTQTRQGRSLNKNQRDSQKWDFSSMVRASGCGPEDGGSIPSFPSTWQKSGIGVAAVSPVPLRGIR